MELSFQEGLRKERVVARVFARFISKLGEGRAHPEKKDGATYGEEPECDFNEMSCVHQADGPSAHPVIMFENRTNPSIGIRNVALFSYWNNAGDCQSSCRMRLIRSLSCFSVHAVWLFTFC